MRQPSEGWPLQALLSVFDKTGIVEFARALVRHGFVIWSSGGTAKVLAAAGIPVLDMAMLSGGSAILGHRVVTLCREKSAALLARPSVPGDMAELKKIGDRLRAQFGGHMPNPFIDLVCCDMYPLQDEVGRDGADDASVIEKTDIGGPTMIAEAAKGLLDERIVICGPLDRVNVIGWLDTGCQDDVAFRRKLAAKAWFNQVAYRLLTARWFDSTAVGLLGHEVRKLRYGQNAPQTARQISWETGYPLAVDQFRLDERSETPSSTNLLDVSAGVRTMLRVCAGMDRNPTCFPDPDQRFVMVCTKHATPCSAVVATDPIEAARRLIKANPVSVMGGFVFANFPITLEVATVLRTTLCEKKRGLDGVVAPSFTLEAIEYLDRVDGRCKIFSNPAFTNLTAADLPPGVRYLDVIGGAIEETHPLFVPQIGDPDFTIDGGSPDLNEWGAIIFMYCVAASAKSNTVAIGQCDGGRCFSTVGIGAGQTDRVSAAELAVKYMTRDGHAGNGRTKVSAGDSFYPFPDGLQALLRAGVCVNFATSGSRNDADVAAASTAAHGTLVRLPDKKARGFEH